MLFASFDFLLFLPVVFGGYWALRGYPVARALVVVLASYFFYMAGPKPQDGPLPTPWYFVGLLVVSTVTNYGCALRMADLQAAAPPGAPGPRAGRVWLLVSLATNLGLLAYFKYTGFLLEIARDAAAFLGTPTRLPTFDVLLPVGISFYTFQGVSYTVDVYRGTVPVERSLLRLAFFKAFFPQLVAGPIVRASDFLPQLDRRPALTREDVDFALFRITKGLVKKVLLGDFLAASLADPVFASPTEYSSLENLLALYAFTLQIYADFSGYSDVAIGVARLFGFRIAENFDRPYAATDIADFWRRWHMTLSTWLRDYVYHPLGGSRVGAARGYVNLWLTMFLIGMWHGASWNFVIYASLQGFAMVYSRFCRLEEGPWPRRFARLFGVSILVGLAVTLLGARALRLSEPWAFGLAGGTAALAIGLLPRADQAPRLRPLHVLVTLHFCVLSRVFFRSDSLTSAREMVSKLAEWDGLGVRDRWFELQGLAAWLKQMPGAEWAAPLAHSGVLLLLVLGFLVHYTPAKLEAWLAERLLPRTPGVLVGLALACLLGVFSLLLAGPRANIYFSF